MADMKKVTDYLTTAEILAQMAEEASELAQAALKLRRAYDGTNPTPKSVEECEANLLEELAEVWRFQKPCTISVHGCGVQVRTGHR